MKICNDRVVITRIATAICYFLICIIGCTAEYRERRRDINVNAIVNGVPLTNLTGPLTGTCNGKNYDMVTQYCNGKRIKECKPRCGRLSKKSMGKCKRLCRLYYMCIWSKPIDNISEKDREGVCAELFNGIHEISSTDVVTSTTSNNGSADTGTPDKPDDTEDTIRPIPTTHRQYVTTISTTTMKDSERT